ncbi:hypothetical protein D3C86_2149420 [compost metagenome]
MREQHRYEAQLDADNGEQNEERGTNNDIRADNEHIIQRKQRLLRTMASDMVNRNRAHNAQNRRDGR